MEKKSDKDGQVKIERFHFSVRLKAIFFPLDLGDLIPIFKEIGFSVRQELIGKIPDAPIGAKIVAGGNIAEKLIDRLTFRMDPDRGIITIVGQEVNIVIDNFSNFEKHVKDKLNLSLEKDALFYEFVGEGSANTGSDPTKVVAKLYEESKLLPKISEIVGFPAANFGIRIVEQKQYVNETKWFEYKIEPLIIKPNTSYQISVVYRHPERAEVEQAAISLKKTIEKLISAMEQEA